MRIARLFRFFAFALFAALGLILVAPGCGRSSLELEVPTEAGPSPGTCSPSTCPNGCCDGSGQCRVGSDSRACGGAGGSCTDCIAQGFEFCDAGRKTCGRNVTVCDALTCAGGCCDTRSGVSLCLAGNENSACGQGGLACRDCEEQGRSCDQRLRTCSTQSCGPANCPNGCCVGNQCLPGTSALSCGNGGESCRSCAAGQVCRAQPDGGECRGAPVCNAMTCPNGCCRNGQCLNGGDATACGTGGQQCTTCGAGQTCNASKTCEALPTCGPNNCAGCCVGNNCILSPTPAQCGRGGAACAPCAPNNDCQAGVCVPRPCGPLTCLGCCDGAAGCKAGTTNDACGEPTGLACANCAATGKICDGPTRTCVSPCNPASCPGGCCNGDVCVTGVANDQCGTGGVACTDCNATNQVCQGQQCRDRCGPSNCAGGCCLPSNACTLGVANSACGSNGAACANCTASGAVCDTGAVPRACTPPGTCPAAYGGCGGVVTPSTPQLQNLCPDDDLTAMQGACGAGPDSASCQTALATLAAINPDCATCLGPFLVPFTQLSGIYRCVAPFVSATCNGSTGCATDCQLSSCDQCPPASENQCRTDVILGQCGTLFQSTATCVNESLAAGQPARFCSPAIYGFLNTYGNWLRAVGGRYCGDGT